MTQGGADYEATEARAMLGAFVLVGAAHFDLSIIDLDGNKVSFRRGVAFRDLKRNIPALLRTAEAKQHNVIVRPYGPGISLVQLDDLKAEMLPKLAPAVFLTLQTSPGNYQAWVAIPGAEDKDFARRLRKGTGADATASGATRVAGSLNFKQKYAPNFPRVLVEDIQATRTVTAADLDQLGLVAAREKAPSRPARRSSNGAPRAWPDYARCLREAPANSAGNGPDVSRADYTFCLIALDWGWSPEDVEARLMEESTKADENGEIYAARTVTNAAAAISRRGATPRRTPNSPKQG